MRLKSGGMVWIGKKNRYVCYIYCRWRIRLELKMRLLNRWSKRSKLLRMIMSVRLKIFSRNIMKGRK